MDNNDVVILNLDKPRVLRLGHLALKRISAMTGLGMVQIMTSYDRWDILSIMIYSALVVDDPALTVDEVDRMLDKLPPKEISEKLGAAVALAFPTDEDSEGGEDPQTAAGTGEKA